MISPLQRGDVTGIALIFPSIENASISGADKNETLEYLILTIHGGGQIVHSESASSIDFHLLSHFVLILR